MYGHAGMPRVWSEQHIRELARQEIEKSGGGITSESLTALIKLTQWNFPKRSLSSALFIAIGSGYFTTYTDNTASGYKDGSVWADLELNNYAINYTDFIEFESQLGSAYCFSTYPLGELNGKVTGFKLLGLNQKVYEREGNNLIVYLYDKNSEHIFDLASEFPEWLLSYNSASMLSNVASECANRLDDTRPLDIDGQNNFRVKVSDYAKSKITELFPDVFPDKMIIKGLRLYN